jgi:AraC family transcriptional regulator
MDYFRGVDFQEREIGGPWITHRIRKGSFFLTFGGAPYDIKWKAAAPEPFEAMFVFVALALIQRAFDEIFGGNSMYAQLKDVSGFDDVAMSLFVQQLRSELAREQASPLLVQGIGQAVAVHLARN